MSIKEDKYYFTRYSSYSATSSIVSRLGQYYLVEVDENVDHHQYISFSFDKLKTGMFDKPQNSTYKTVRPVKEVFLSHYSLAIKYVYEITLDDGEFFLVKKSSSWYKIAYYSKDEKDKQLIEIDFRDGIEDIWLTLTGSLGHKGRPQYRKEALAITKEHFMQFLNCTLQFLFDSDSYAIFFDDYLRKFYQLIKGEGKIEGFIISAEKSFEKIISQLIIRKENLGQRLIENDTDSVIDRAKLRGELDGINYVIKTIKVNAN